MTEDILERAKALRSSAFGTHKQALDVVDELIAEVEWLRSENRELKKTDVWANDVIKEHESLNARINGLEAEAQEYHDKKEEALTLCAGQNRYIERLEAEFLESEAYAHACMGESMPVNEEDLQAARDELERIKEEREG